MDNASIFVRQLPNVPPSDSNIQAMDFVVNGTKVVLVYEVAGNHEWVDQHVCVEFHGVRKVVGGLPNDEAFQNHPLYKYGLEYYGDQEIVNSPWIDEQLRIADRDGKVNESRKRELRHFVFALKEDTVEVLAESYKVHGPFVNLGDARRKAASLAWGIPF